MADVGGAGCSHWQKRRKKKHSKMRRHTIVGKMDCAREWPPGGFACPLKLWHSRGRWCGKWELQTTPRSKGWDVSYDFTRWNKDGVHRRGGGWGDARRCGAMGYEAGRNERSMGYTTGTEVKGKLLGVLRGFFERWAGESVGIRRWTRRLASGRDAGPKAKEGFLAGRPTAGGRQNGPVLNSFNDRCGEIFLLPCARGGEFCGCLRFDVFSAIVDAVFR